jgi:ribonuclease HI
MQEMVERLDFRCTNNQSEYEALIAGLRYMICMGVKDVEVFGHSQLVVRQVRGESHCLDGTLNQYRDICARLVSGLDTFHIEHVYRGCNGIANELAQQASDYEVQRGVVQYRKVAGIT